MTFSWRAGPVYRFSFGAQSRRPLQALFDYGPSWGHWRNGLVVVYCIVRETKSGTLAVTARRTS